MNKPVAQHQAELETQHDPITPLPHVSPGTDFQTEMRINMSYMVVEVNRQGKILGNGDGLIATVRWLAEKERQREKDRLDDTVKELKSKEVWRSRFEWVIVTALTVTFVVWLAVTLVKLGANPK